MGKTLIDTNVFIPMPVVLAGTVVEGRPNFMAVGWVARVNAQPPLIGVGIHKSHHTARGILAHQAFSVCIPSADLADRTDYCGLVSGSTDDKSAVFNLFYGELKAAPLIRECPLCLECRLVHTGDFATNLFFVGEITAAHAETVFLKDGKPDWDKINPLILTMPDNRYWRLGESVGTAWSMGKRAELGTIP
jgi:flavin reductase (DIM6/NTAB) family NADH-FMN oxidoreductase RutF